MAQGLLRGNWMRVLQSLELAPAGETAPAPRFHVRVPAAPWWTE